MAIEPDRWQRIRELFDQASDLVGEEQRQFLDRECGDDEELRREVDALLDHDMDSSGDTASLGDMVGTAAREVVEPTHDLVGETVGHIRILGLLGRGGMGEVYVGFDETLERRVALKAIHPRHRLSDDSRSRFLREARILSQLDHPNICRIFDYIDGDEHEREFLVLELIEGRQLGEAIRSGMEPAHRLEVALQIATALAAAHDKGIVHRDLKPQNVMLTDGGETKVLDFGLAWSGDPPRDAAFDAHSVHDENGAETADMAYETRRGQIVGTPLYMSPEQARGEPAEAASDMYSFGLLLQRLFTEAAPRSGRNVTEILLEARRGETREVAGVDKDLAALIGELTSPAPASRPTARTTLERLRWIRDKPRRRLRYALAAAAVLLVILGVTKYALDLRAARDRAEVRRQQAEELIDFMIGDLRSKLAPVNRLAVLDDIGDKAIEYFEAVSAEELSPRELLLRSQTLSQIGQVRLEEGDLVASASAFAASLNLARKLAELEPENEERLMWLGAAHFWVGSVHFQRRELDQAQQSFESYLEIARNLVASDPTHLEAQLEFSYALNNLGAVLKARQESRQAIGVFLASLETKKRLVAARPENEQWQSDLGGTHSWLGDAYLAVGDLRNAMEHHSANLEILGMLSKRAPEDLQRRWLLGIAHEKLGRLERLAGRTAEAGSHFESYLEIFEALSHHDPENQMRRREFALANVRLGRLRVGEHPEEAQELLLRGEEILDQLVRASPDSIDLQVGRASAQIALAQLYGTTGRSSDAETLCRTVVDQLQILAADSSESGSAGWRLAEAEFVLGTVHQSQKRPEEARRVLESALRRTDELVESSQRPEYRELRARVLLRLGRTSEAQAQIEELRQVGVQTVELSSVTAGSS